ncbi:unnamed protein product [marine sediment metagenome]|uniref:Cation:proton antiporter n=1 Tax=marine sediment metagenome TaxID=412755 RepID=X1M4Q0_9ZZZZ
MPANMVPYLLTLILLVVGLYALVAKKNLIKIIIGVLTIEYAANLLLLLVGFRAPKKGPPVAPILTKGVEQAKLIEQAVDPLPQALVLTSIVIGLGMVALMVAFGLRLYEKYETFDITRIRKLKG